MKLELRNWVAKVNSYLLGGIVPDYANAVAITSLPYTAPSFGIVMYVVGDGSISGARNLTINGIEVGIARNMTNGSASTITAVVGKGDIVSGTYGVWGAMRFIPYKFGGGTT